MRIEEQHGRLTPARLRLYHSMYQLFSFTMLLALLTNNLGILILGVFMFQIREQFDSLDIRHLEKLKDS